MNQHLEIIRTWMQQNANNGDTVTWGSDQPLALGCVTVRDLEELAMRIYKAGLDRGRLITLHIADRYARVTADQVRFIANVAAEECKKEIL